MVENKTETKIVMLTIKEAAALVEGLTGAFLIDISAELWYNVGGGNAP